MTENDLHSMVVRHVLGLTTRLENLISSGVFDANLFYQDHEVWCEYKIEYASKIHVRGPQYVWATRRITQGMTNLYFLVANKKAKVRLYLAEDILMRCDFTCTDKEGSFIVDISDIPPINSIWSGDRAWAVINKAFFNC